MLSSCYSQRRSNGGAQTNFAPPRKVDSRDIALPEGYQIEVVAKDLTFPTGAAFDDAGRLHVVESGYAYGEVWATPRLLRIEQNGTSTVIASGWKNGPWTGVAFHNGSFYVAEGGAMEGGKILRIAADGKIDVIVDGLPSFGDHHTDGPAVSSDGWIYFGQGTASNSGIVGEDNAKFGWLKRRPDFHDIPGKDIVLAGENFETKDFVNINSPRKVRTGAFVPFGTPTEPNQVVKGAVKCSGAILRVRPGGEELQMVAWGLRNPFGLTFSPAGELYVTENAYDERGSRPVWGAADVLWKVQSGLWYGWPDFSEGEPVNTKYFKAPGMSPSKFLLAEHPNTPPKPVAKFGVHSSANGLDFSRNERFGHVGEAFVALLGDQSPSVGKLLHPVGFKVVRVNVESGWVDDFAVNLGANNGPASKMKRGGLERPIAVRFNPDGNALYVVDFGVMTEDKKGAHPVQNTGIIWKISRDHHR